MRSNKRKRSRQTFENKTQKCESFMGTKQEIINFLNKKCNQRNGDQLNRRSKRRRCNES